MLDLGTYVTNVDIVPYVRPSTVFFSATGMKPNTRVWAFFAGSPVTGYCRQLANYVGDVYTAAGHFYTSTGVGLVSLSDPTGADVFFTIQNGWNTQLVTDAHGTLFGQFAIPSGIFKTGQIEFKVCDVSDRRLVWQCQPGVSSLIPGLWFLRSRRLLISRPSSKSISTFRLPSPFRLRS
jgi:hypothetical protein